MFMVWSQEDKKSKGGERDIEKLKVKQRHSSEEKTLCNLGLGWIHVTPAAKELIICKGVVVFVVEKASRGLGFRSWSHSLQKRERRPEIVGTKVALHYSNSQN